MKQAVLLEVIRYLELKRIVTVMTNLLCRMKKLMIRFGIGRIFWLKRQLRKNRLGLKLRQKRQDLLLLKSKLDCRQISPLLKPRF